jgi:hypothetical protein
VSPPENAPKLKTTVVLKRDQIKVMNHSKYISRQNSQQNIKDEKYYSLPVKTKHPQQEIKIDDPEPIPESLQNTM